ncbi:MAG: efflux RND transporter periplasmic adaptor subunit [Candidatus Edwardsbacteria bacterium]
MQSLKIIVSLTIMAMVASCGSRNSQTKQTSEEVGLTVQVYEVKNGNIEDRLSLIGTIAPLEQITVFSKVPGKLVRNMVEEGNRVTVDQTIALVNRDEIGVEFTEAPIKSPITGTVAKLHLDSGAAVAPTIPIATIVKMGTVKVLVNVIEKEIGRLRKGLKAEISVDAYPSKKFTGSISNISPIVDPLSHTVKTEIRVGNPGLLLKPGMSANVSLILGRHQNVPLVPKDAILQKLGEEIVYLFEAGLAKRVIIKTGYDDGHFVEVLSGVRAGDKLIVSDQSVLQDGVRVKVE